MQTEITPESSKIIEEMSWQYSQYDQAASAHMDGMLAALTSPELLQAQGLSIVERTTIKKFIIRYNMETATAVKILEDHNKWRRGDDDMEMADPKQLGEAIDFIVSQLKHPSVKELKKSAYELLFESGIDDSGKLPPFLEIQKRKETYLNNLK